MLNLQELNIYIYLHNIEVNSFAELVHSYECFWESSLNPNLGGLSRGSFWGGTGG